MDESNGNNGQNALLAINQLRVVYKTDMETVEAVNDIDLTVRKGTTLGLVGETGAGKTTTGLSIMRLLPYNTGKVLGGSIFFDGHDIMSMNEAEIRKVRGKRIAMVFQDPMTSLNPVMTIGDQISEAITLHDVEIGKKSIKERKEILRKRIGDMLALVGIAPARQKDYPHQFSGGMKQRVIIAIALTCEPD